MNVIFKLDKPNTDKSLIMMVYRFNGNKLLISTSISVKTEHWNPNTQRVFEKKGYPEYITYNKTIEKYRLALLNSWDSFISRNEKPSIVQLRNAINDIVNPEKNASIEYPSNVCKFITKVIENIGDRKNETSKVYSQILKNLQTYKNGAQLEFKDLSLAVLENFSKYYCETKRESGEFYRRGTVYRHLKHFITIINKASDHGITVNNAYKKPSWRITAPKDEISGNDVILSDDEIKILEIAELNERFDKIRDFFLLGLYTGQRYSDYAKLSVDNVITENGKQYLQIVQQKTKELIKIPYSNKIKDIFVKYNGYPQAISLQKFNVALKELCKSLDFNDPIIIYNDIPALNKVEKKIFPKWQFISTHSARRTFCTNAILKGIPEKIIMKISGHKNIRIFHSYVRINTETKANDDLLFQYFG